MRNKIVTPTKFTNENYKWGNDNEQNALIKYQEHMEKHSRKVGLCYSCGLVVNPKWPWLGASPDSLAKDLNEQNKYGAVEVKCPASEADLTITKACQDKSFFLELKDNVIKLKHNRVYYYQCQGVMAICQLNWLDFVVFTKNDLHVERILFDEHEWVTNMLPELTALYFSYLMDLV